MSESYDEGEPFPHPDAYPAPPAPCPHPVLRRRAERLVELIDLGAPPVLLRRGVELIAAAGAELPQGADP